MKTCAQLPSDISLSQLPFKKMGPILNAMGEGVLIVSKSGVTLAVNQAAKILYNKGVMLEAGMLFSEYAPVDWVEICKVIKSGQGQIHGITRQEYGNVLVNRIPLFSGTEVIAVICTIQDMGAWDDILPRLNGFKKLESEYTAVLEQLGDAYFIIDAFGSIKRVNSAYERLSGQSEVSLFGMNINLLKRDPLLIIPLLKKVLETQSGTGQYTQYGGSPFLITCTPVFDKEGSFIFVVCRIHDFSAFESIQSQYMSEGFPSLAKNQVPAQEESIQKICAQVNMKIQSKSMKQLVSQAIKVSRVDSCVLIQGESGVGKTLLASLIHHQGARSEKPFVTINCGAIPESLIESELFGYEKGAFTGANPHGKPGIMETANHGTLFLDEIGELKYPLQAKLLEVIERKSFMRVGGTKRIEVDVRFITATNRDLQKEVEAGNFRRDLYYRLNVIPLWIPPLRNRPEDVMFMINDIINEYNVKHAGSKKISQTAMSWLLNYKFPGNVRELINIMEWMIVMGEGDTLTLHDLPTNLRKSAEHEAEERPEENIPSYTASDTNPQGFPLPQEIEEVNLPLKEAVEIMEKTYIARAMEKYGTLQHASQFLQVHFSTLWRKALHYGLVSKKENSDSGQHETIS